MIITLCAAQSVGAHHVGKAGVWAEEERSESRAADSTDGEDPARPGIRCGAVIEISLAERACQGSPARVRFQEPAGLSPGSTRPSWKLCYKSLAPADTTSSAEPPPRASPALPSSLSSPPRPRNHLPPRPLGPSPARRPALANFVAPLGVGGAADSYNWRSRRIPDWRLAGFSNVNRGISRN